MAWWIPLINAIAGNSNSKTGQAVGTALSYANKQKSEDKSENKTS